MTFSQRTLSRHTDMALKLGAKETNFAFTFSFPTSSPATPAFNTKVNSRPTKPSPINSLPPEILIEIFKARLDDNTQDHIPPSALERHGRSMSTFHSPCTLSQVCRNWRIVLLSSPDFWTRICLTFDVSLCNDAFEQLYLIEMLETFLERSRDLGLSVVLKSKKEPKHGPVLVAETTREDGDESPRKRHSRVVPATHKTVLDTLLSDRVRNRMKSLAVRVADPIYARYLLDDLFLLDTDSLKTLTLAFPSRNRSMRDKYTFFADSFDDDDIHLHADSVPSLEQFVVYAPTNVLFCPETLADGGWGNLRVFRWESDLAIFVDDVKYVVEACPLLEELHTTVHEMSSSDPDQRTPIYAQHLGAASFVCCSHQAAIVLMSSIIMPHLTSFKLIANTRGLPGPLWPFRTLFPEYDECSADRIEGLDSLIPVSTSTLSLLAGDVPEEVTLATLRALPRISQLGIRGMRVSKLLLEAFFIRPFLEGSWHSGSDLVFLCPLLQELDISHCRTLGGGMINIITTRTFHVPANAPVRRLTRLNSPTLYMANHYFVTKGFAERENCVITNSDELLFP